MPQNVNVPGIGQLQFPDGMSQADMAAAIQKNFPQLHAGGGDLSNQIPGNEHAVSGNRNVGQPAPASTDTTAGKIFGNIEPAIAMGTGAIGSTLGSIAGVGKSLVGGHYGTQQGVREGEELAGNIADALTYQPRTQTGQLRTQQIGDAMERSGIIGVPIPELEAMARGVSSSRAALGGLARANAGAVDAADAAARAGRPLPVPAPDVPVAPAAPAVNYDVPTYVRRGIDPNKVAPAPAAPAVPELPAATPAGPQSALDAYAQKPMASPFGTLNEPVPLPAAGSQSALDELAATQRPGAAPALNPLESGLRLPEEAPAPAIAAPVAPTDALVAQTADTSDIQAVLDQFGIKLPGKEPAPAAPVAGGAGGGGAGEPPVPPVDLNFDHTGPLDPAQRQQVLGNVGVTKLRKSALESNEAAAATDYQLSKYTNEPAGMAALDQFAHERDALASHAQGLIDRSGAVSGLDESALQAKGQDLAAPIDAARKHFEEAKRALYDIADKRAAATGAPVQTGSLDALLGDHDFQATLMAKDQQGLLNTIQSQYDRFKALGPEKQLTMTNAEKFRKWLNAVWSPDNSQTLRQVKAALDEGVFKTAGTDVYQSARQLHMQEMRIFDDPKGIVKMFDSDPFTPINRATAYNKIPDAILNLSPDQFKHIIDTYKNLPEALQPEAQRAIATLRAHYGDKLLNAGTATGYGNARQLWNRGGVNQIVRNNSAKLPMVFGPEDLAQIRDLVDAGNILSVNATYPGASAQAAQALKRGALSRYMGKGAAALGGSAGAVFGPAGAGAGALVGDALGTKIVEHIGERKALNEFKKGIIDTARGK